MTYCEFVRSESAHQVHRDYHDNDYGFPLIEDNALFERLILEINQAGLSWEMILKRRAGFRLAYDQFDIAKVANYGEENIARLLLDARIIRNKLKVRAAVHNAQVILGLQQSHGSFWQWLEMHHAHELSREEWTKLFKKTFTFTGGEIVNEFLMSTGYLPGAHEETCPIFAKTQK